MNGEQRTLELPALQRISGGGVFKVLVASRNREAQQCLSDTLKLIPQISVQDRILINGSSDPLHGSDILPDLLVFRLTEHWVEELEALRNRPADKRPPVLVISGEADPAIMRRAMQVGARDFFIDPCRSEELGKAVTELYLECQQQAKVGCGRMTAIINAKGGSGASMLASNLAHMLAVERHRRVALMDLDLQFGSLSQYLDLKVRHGITEALNNIDDMDQVALEGYMVKHSSGLRIMGVEEGRLMLTDEVSGERLMKLVKLIAEHYQHLIIDLPRQIDINTSTILEAVDQIFVVVQQSLTHLRDATRLMEVLREEMDIPADRIHVVLNRYQKQASITLDEVGKALHQPVDQILTIPNDFKHVEESLNQGIPLYEVAKRAPINRALTDLMTTVEGEPEPNGVSMFGRLFAKLRGV
ncbi:AAA family ATPase [Marinobacterium arenosum]|uniref:AAA family ATPase n=1 Tax=Marinobacterium arenosum TaxID=2862496 RepID=UPI001C98C3EA|nr:AAA family ATPase [Marinobacterium arenosum]MBY4675739.1 AAA family ATPase [Marinobacterium arenosum]